MPEVAVFKRRRTERGDWFFGFGFCLKTMDMLKDNKEPDEEYWNDCEKEDFDEPFSKSIMTKRLVDGINIKDLCDGKEIIFEVNNEDILESEEESNEEIVHHNSRTMRENRGAPPLDCSFEQIASQMTNVTENGFVKKQIVTAGTGKIVPDNAFVTVHYNLYKESCALPFDSTYLRNRPERFRLDQGQAILGLEHAIKSMKKNENSKFFIKWEVAFGALGCPDRIEKKCDIVADVTLLNFAEIDPENKLKMLSEISKVDFTHFIKHSKQLLCNGSDEFLKGDAKAAVSCYRKALRILNNLRLANKEEEMIMLQEKVKCLVNLAVCYNKLGKPEQACLACQEVLSIDQNNIKANFHYGRANLSLSNFSIAQKYLLRANSLKPNDKDINREIKKLNDKKALHELKDKMFWKKALTKEDEKEKSKKEEVMPLEAFEKSLRASLEESVKQNKPYTFPMPLLDQELEVCDRVAAQMKMEFKKEPDFCTFKNAENNCDGGPN